MSWHVPFEEIERMKREIDMLTHAIGERAGLRFVPSGVFPSVNITEDKDKYYVRAELPGIKSDEIDIRITGRNLMISGERKIPFEGENVKYHRREREAGKFSRVIGLPGETDTDNVNAKMVNGVLTVTIAKSEASQPKQITVK